MDPCRRYSWLLLICQYDNTISDLSAIWNAGAWVLSALRPVQSCGNHIDFHPAKVKMVYINYTSGWKGLSWLVGLSLFFFSGERGIPIWFPLTEASTSLLVSSPSNEQEVTSLEFDPWIMAVSLKPSDDNSQTLDHTWAINRLLLWDYKGLIMWCVILWPMERE